MPKRLRLDAMHERHRALTPALAGAYREAASVCLNRHHLSPIEVTLSDNEVDSLAEMAWEEPNSQVLDAWANQIDTTELGAYGCVLAGLEELRGLVAVRRADTGTGADYYVGYPGAGEMDLEDCFRLEVSGVDSGDRKEVVRRLLQKLQQAGAGRSSLPALAGVMGFAARNLVVKDVGDNP